MKQSKRFIPYIMILLLLLAACQEAPAPAPTSAPETADSSAEQPTEPAPTAEPPTATPEPEPTAVPTQTPTATPEPLPLRLGLLLPLSGTASTIGQAQRSYAQAALALFNERTGLAVELVEADSQLNAEEGVEQAEQLAADEAVLAVIGPTGFEVCEATQPIFAEAGLAHLTPACTADFLTSPGTSTFFRPIANEAVQSQTLTDFLTDGLGVTAVYIVDDQTDYSLNIANALFDQLTDAGVPNVLRAAITDPALMPDFVTDANRSDAEAVLYATLDLNLLSEMATALETAEFPGAYIMTDSGFVLDLAQGAIDEALADSYTAFFAPVPSLLDSFAPLLAVVDAADDPLLDAYGAAAAQATTLALAAVESCAAAGDPSRDCVVTTLGSQTVAETPFGEAVAFDANNEWENGRFFIYQIQNGDLQLVMP